MVWCGGRSRRPKRSYPPSSCDQVLDLRPRAPRPAEMRRAGGGPATEGRELPAARRQSPGATPLMASRGSPPSLPSVAAPASPLAARRRCRPPGRTRLVVSTRCPAHCPVAAALRPRDESFQPRGGATGGGELVPRGGAGFPDRCPVPLPAARPNHACRFSQAYPPAAAVGGGPATAAESGHARGGAAFGALVAAASWWTAPPRSPAAAGAPSRWRAD